MDPSDKIKNKINWKAIGGQTLVIAIAVVLTLTISHFMYKDLKTVKTESRKQETKVEVSEDKKVDNKVSQDQKIATVDKLEVIDYGNGGKLLKTAADVESLDASSKVKDFLKKEVEKANAWNKEIQEKHGGSGIQYEPKIYKIYGDYFAYFSGYDTGAGPRIWGPAIGGEKEQTQEGTVVAKQGEIIGLYGLYTTCSNILKYKIPYELFADYKLVGGMELTIGKCREAERRL